MNDPSASEKNFAEDEKNRVVQLKSLLEKNRLPLPKSILLYGCGTGESIPFLKEIFPSSCLTGTDRQPGLLEIARKNQNAAAVRFLNEEEIRDELFDLVFCNGLFHHIKPMERISMLEFIRNHIRQDGHFAFLENNPWNPAQKLRIKKSAVAEEISVISPSKAIRLMESQGFQWITLRSFSYFPRWLSFLQFVEFFLGRFAFGGQYLVLYRVLPVFYES